MQSSNFFFFPYKSSLSFLSQDAAHWTMINLSQLSLAVVDKARAIWLKAINMGDQ